MAETTEGTRINKYLSAAGFCSRRQADRLIEEGRVEVGESVATLGTKVLPKDTVYVDGKPVVGDEPQEVLLLVNKPKGIVCTAEKREKDNIIDFLHYPTRIYPIGRLDKDSHGLILMTNVGSLHNEITRAANGHEKEYLVKVNKRIDGRFIRHMEEGVYLPELDLTTAPAEVWKRSDNVFSIVLREGRNRQIRRMCRELSYRVLDLERIRVMHFQIDGIPEGQYRKATAREWAELRRRIKGEI